MQITPITFKDIVRPDVHLNEEITWRAAVDPGLTFTGKTNAVAAIDSGGHFNREGLGFIPIAAAMTDMTGIFDLFARTLTAWAGLLHREEALFHAHLTMTGAGAAVNRLRARLGASTFTLDAGHGGRNANLDGSTAHRLFQVQLQVVT